MELLNKTQQELEEYKQMSLQKEEILSRIKSNYETLSKQLTNV